MALQRGSIGPEVKNLQSLRVDSPWLATIALEGGSASRRANSVMPRLLAVGI
jgi:hypothetical protein